jgi:hypothetical protein
VINSSFGQFSGRIVSTTGVFPRPFPLDYANAQICKNNAKHRLNHGRAQIGRHGRRSRLSEILLGSSSFADEFVRPRKLWVKGVPIAQADQPRLCRVNGVRRHRVNDRGPKLSVGHEKVDPPCRLRPILLYCESNSVERDLKAANTGESRLFCVHTA